MTYTLNIGPGSSGVGDVKVDLFPYPGVDHLVDIAVDPLPFPDNTFDKVLAEQVLEHLPTCIRWKENQLITVPTLGGGTKATRVASKWHRRWVRVEVMREIFRVLKPGGILHASVPKGYPEWAQDPTHDSVPWPQEMFGYFAGQWGGNEEGKEPTCTAGIDFAFEWVDSWLNERGSILSVQLRKPK